MRAVARRIGGDTKPLLHDRAGGGVLQELPLLRIEWMLNSERSEARFVEAAQDQLLLTRVGIDVADREDAGHAGLEVLGVHLKRLFLHFETPLGDGTEL